MSNLSELEVEFLRHLIGGHGLVAKKLETYAQNATCQELKGIFQKDAQAAKAAQQELMTFLG